MSYMHSFATIREVANHFGLPFSTLHYWERRGLLTPTRQVGGRRVYDTDQVYRVALIEMWRRKGHMSIEEIADLLGPTRQWRTTIAARREDIERQIHDLEQARDYLIHLSGCSHGPALEKCPGFRDSVSVPASVSAG